MKFAVLVGSLILAVTLSVAQENPFSLRVDVNAVSVDVSVVDGSGRPLVDLNASDFLLYEDEVAQRIGGFEQGIAPYNALLLLDCSGSTNNDQPLFSDAAGALAKNLRPQDNLQVAAFGSRVSLLFDRKTNRRNSLNSVWRKTCGGTEFYEALRWAVDALRKQDGRKGVFVYTDGRDTGAPTQRVTVDGRKRDLLVEPARDKTFQSVLRLLKTSQIPFYFVAVNTDNNPSPLASPEDRSDQVQARLRMAQLAEVSGGRILYPKTLDEIVPFFDQISRELSSGYTLSYTPSKAWTDSQFRRIDVFVKTRGARITQSRAGYTPR